MKLDTQNFMVFFFFFFFGGGGGGVENMDIYLHLLAFSDTEMAQVFEIVRFWGHWLAHPEQLETNWCVFNSVATDALVL